MAFQIFRFWEIALDGVQILLCGIILLFLIRNKLKYNQLILKASSKNNSNDFPSEIILQSLRQQTEQIFDSILHFIQQERLSLKNFHDIREIKQYRSSFVFEPENQTATIDPITAKSGIESDSRSIDQIIALSNKGLSLTDISEKAKIPRGEVRLILRLNNKTKPC